MLNIGQYQSLEVVKLLDFGAYLDGGAHGEILLPKRYVPEDTKVGDSLEVFIYHDGEGRLIATTEKAKALVGEFALLKVNSVNPIGAFLDWLPYKELLLPYKEQTKNQPIAGQFVFVYVYLDEKSERCVASMAIKKFLRSDAMGMGVGLAVKIMIAGITDLGYNCVVNGTHLGLLYHNEVFKKIDVGDKLEGFIKTLREDGKIDLSLQKQGIEGMKDGAQELYNALQQNDGYLPLSDHSSPEEIYDLLGISKKTFKRASGILFRQRLVMLEERGIKLITEQNKIREREAAPAKPKITAPSHPQAPRTNKPEGRDDAPRGNDRSFRR